MRVLAAAALLVTITSAVMGLLGTALLHGYLLSRTDDQLKSFASPRRATQARRAWRSRPQDAPRPGQFQLPSDFVVQIVDASGRGTWPPGRRTGSPAAAVRRAVARHRSPVHGAAAGDPGHSWRVIVRATGDGRHLVTGLSLDDVNSTVTQLALIDAAAGALGIAVLAAVGLLLVRASLAPLNRIEETAEAIAAGDLSRRISHPSERTEVGRGRRPGRHARPDRGRLPGQGGRRHTRGSRRHTPGLRGPDAAVCRGRQPRAADAADLDQGTGRVRPAAGRGGRQAELLRLVGRIQQEAARMGLLVNDLLLLARLDEDRPLDRRPVDLSSIAAEAVQAARTVQPGRPVTLAAAPDPVIVDADDTRIRQVIDNLISNALQHTRPAPRSPWRCRPRPVRGSSPSPTAGPA